jgi:biotin transport system ATP-binding protein
LQLQLKRRRTGNLGEDINFLDRAVIPAEIQLSEVSLVINGKGILDDVSFNAVEHRIGIVGRNGSGKTTLARVMAGLATPTAGHVRIMHVDVAKDRQAAIGAIGILFQNPDHQIIFPTVEEEIAFGLVQMGLSKEDASDRVAGLLDEFGKAHWAKAAIHQLSHGQKQLVCLMSILAMEPKIIVMDEPFSGLDIPTRTQLARYLERVDATLVHISHEADYLRSYDRVIWLENGKIAMDGAPKPVLAAFSRRMAQIGGEDDISDISG